MEAVAALGLLSSIIQIVDTGVNLVNTAKEIRLSASGMTRETVSLQETARRLRDLSHRIDLPSAGSLSPDQTDLCRLAKECRGVSDEALNLIRCIAPNANSTLESIKSAFLGFKSKQQRKELEQRLQHCQTQLQLQLIKHTR